MPSSQVHCPACHADVIERLQHISDGSRVDYWRCLDCQHVWNVPKDADGPIHHVTPIANRRAAGRH
jgi:transposase-like protein